MDSIPGFGRSPGGGNGNLFQYSCLENPMDRGTWWPAIHRVTKESNMPQQLNNNNMLVYRSSVHFYHVFSVFISHVFRQFSYILHVMKLIQGVYSYFSPSMQGFYICFLLFELLKGRKVKHKILLQGPCIFPFLHEACKVSKTYFSCR